MYSISFFSIRLVYTKCYVYCGAALYLVRYYQVVLFWKDGRACALVPPPVVLASSSTFNMQRYISTFPSNESPPHSRHLKGFIPPPPPPFLPTSASILETKLVGKLDLDDFDSQVHSTIDRCCCCATYRHASPTYAYTVRLRLRTNYMQQSKASIRTPTTLLLLLLQYYRNSLISTHGSASTPQRIHKSSSNTQEVHTHQYHAQRACKQLYDRHPHDVETAPGDQIEITYMYTYQVQNSRVTTRGIYRGHKLPATKNKHTFGRPPAQGGAGGPRQHSRAIAPPEPR